MFLFKSLFVISSFTLCYEYCSHQIRNLALMRHSGWVGRKRYKTHPFVASKLGLFLTYSKYREERFIYVSNYWYATVKYLEYCLARGKCSRNVKLYKEGIRQYLQYCETRGCEFTHKLRLLNTEITLVTSSPFLGNHYLLTLYYFWAFPSRDG
jgi:hypothetical protein